MVISNVVNQAPSPLASAAISRFYAKIRQDASLTRSMAPAAPKIGLTVSIGKLTGLLNLLHPSFRDEPHIRGNAWRCRADQPSTQEP
jgi:hypothetical protein